MHRGSLVLQNDIAIFQECVIALLKRVNIRRAAGPDASVGTFCTIVLSSLELVKIPSTWKTSSIIPPKEFVIDFMQNSDKPKSSTEHGKGVQIINTCILEQCSTLSLT